MAGVPSATLEGWAIAAQRTPWWDHTYVVSSCGLRWGCFGRSAGGSQLAAGTGSSLIADCLSQPASAPGVVPWVYAGLRYGIDGVCHQAANRILFPSGTTVAACAGYPWSVWTYGAYPMPWPELQICAPSGTLFAPSGSLTPAIQGDPMDSKTTYDRTVTKLPSSNYAPEMVQAIELAALVKLRLGRTLDDKLFFELTKAQDQLRQQRQWLASELASGKISQEAYLLLLGNALEQSKRVVIGLLGHEDFAIIFGAAANHPGELVDREAFLKGAPTY